MVVFAWVLPILVALSWPVDAANHGPRLFATSLYQEKFKEWTEAHSKKYSNFSEYAQRLETFSDNHDKIETHNKGNHGWWMGHNKFSDLTESEFEARYLSKMDRSLDSGARLRSDARGQSPLSVSINKPKDWNWKSVLPPANDQKYCGCCWAMAAITVMSAHLSLHYPGFNATKIDKRLSVQYMIDCDDAADACFGGSAEDTWNFLKKERGLPSWDSYPYSPQSMFLKEKGTCQKKEKSPLLKALDPYMEEFDLKDQSKNNQTARDRRLQYESLLLQQGPLWVAVADSPKWQFYKTGIVKTPDPSGKSLRMNHAVALVGYGVGGIREYYAQYWLVQNSYGTDWGEGGYIRLDRSDEVGQGSGILYDMAYPRITP